MTALGRGCQDTGANRVATVLVPYHGTSTVQMSKNSICPFIYLSPIVATDKNQKRNASKGIRESGDECVQKGQIFRCLVAISWLLSANTGMMHMHQGV